MGSFCSTSCVDDSSCTADASCVNGLCVPHCTSDGAGYACIDGVAVSCSDPSAQAARCDQCGCPTDQRCVASKCVDIVPKQTLLAMDGSVGDVKVLDDGIYFTGHAPSSQYSTDLVYTMYSMAKSGGAKRAIGAVPSKPAAVIAEDSANYYLTIWNTTDGSGNRWDANVYSLPRGSSTPTQILGNWSVNVDPQVVGQSASSLWFQNFGFANSWNNWLERVDEASGSRAWQAQTQGALDAYAVEGETLYGVLNDAGTFTAIAVADGIVTQYSLPNLCARFARDGARHRWIGLCKGDVVAFGASGAPTTLAAGVASLADPYGTIVISGNTLAWTEGSAGSMVGVKLFELVAGGTKSIPLHASDWVIGFDAAYVYYETGSNLVRTPLSAATAP